ncbi:MAG TPA: site-specific integrase [Chloroflexota bacterium]|nr:site-specific integrase [Chloroflexota bacterium]
MATARLHQYKNKDDTTTYRIRFDYVDSNSGQRCQPWETLPRGTSEREAKAIMAKKIAQLNSTAQVRPSKLTMGELMVEWLDREARTSVAPTTLEDYEGTVRVHVIPAFGHVPVPKLTTAQVQRWYAEYHAAGHGERVIQLAHLRMRQALDYAMRMGYASQNVVLAARPPRSEEIERQAWSAAEARQFLDASTDSVYWPIWPLLLRCGLRRGEALGLRWADMDLARCVLTVQQNLVVLEGQRHIKGPKNKGSKQRVVLDAEMVEWLAEHREAQQKRHEGLRDTGRDLGLVVTTSVGTPVTPDNITREYDRLIALTGLKRIRVHDMRHTYGTLLHTGGTDLKVISEMMRHRKVGTTGDIYVHADTALQREAVERLATALRAAPCAEPRAKKRAKNG